MPPGGLLGPHADSYHLGLLRLRGPARGRPPFDDGLAAAALDAQRTDRPLLGGLRPQLADAASGANPTRSRKVAAAPRPLPQLRLRPPRHAGPMPGVRPHPGRSDSLKRRLLNLLTALSLLVCVAVVVLWVRSYRVGSVFGYYTGLAGDGWYRSVSAGSCDGWITLVPLHSKFGEGLVRGRFHAWDDARSAPQPIPGWAGFGY